MDIFLTYFGHCGVILCHFGIPVVKIINALIGSYDAVGVFPERQNSNGATVRRFFADLSKESVAKQIAVGGVTGWYV